MNALADVGSNPTIGWIIGGMCWLVLRLIARLEAIETVLGEIVKTLDEIDRKVTRIEKSS